MDSDARKAKLFKKYRSELAAVEAGQIILEIGEIDSGTAAENERVAPSSKRLEDMRTAVEADEGRHAALSLERTAQESAVIESNRQSETMFVGGVTQQLSGRLIQTHEISEAIKLGYRIGVGVEGGIVIHACDTSR